MELTAGTIVGGRFVLDRKLGEGGMGVVWAATHAVTRKTVALKMLKPDKASDPVVRQRFVREARAASVVSHPNIIDIRDVIELEDGAPAMVMDLLQGESLGDRLERERALPIDVLAPLMVQVLSAVGTAHAAGIVHRDLKPDNIFLVAQPGGPSVRVLDFGIAKVMPAGGELPTSRGLTNTGALLGTPFYMAPEQIFGESDIDQQADVWAIGVILYECLAGQRPTEAENIGQILRIISDDAIVPLPQVAPEVPDDVTSLVARMLSRKRTARPMSLLEAFEVMRRYAPGVVVPSFSRPAAGTTREPPSPPVPPASNRAIIPSDGEASPTAATLASTTASITADRVAGLPSRRRRALPVRLAVVVGLGACGLAIFLGTRQGPTASAPSAAVSYGPAPSMPVVPAIPPPLPTAAATLEPMPSVSAVASGGRRAPPGPVPPHPAATASAPPPAPSSPAAPRPSPYEHM